MIRAATAAFLIVATGAALTGGAGSTLGQAQDTPRHDAAPSSAQESIHSASPAAGATAPAETKPDTPTQRQPATKTPTQQPTAQPSSPGSPSPAPARKVRAAGGQAILSSAENAALMVSGIIQSSRKLDATGWTAELAVDRKLLGDVQVGTTVQIAWEELAASRQVRFDDGERVLVVLEPLPAQSLWARRFADAQKRVYVVARNGEAFLRSPDATTLNSLEHYLAMGREARKGAPGARRLAELIASGHRAIAMEALDVLENRTDLAAALGDDGGSLLLQAARSEGRDHAIRARALRLAAKSGLRGVKEAALALAQPGSSMRAEAYRALGILPHGLTPQEAEALLDDPDPELRVVGIALATDPAKRERLIKMARSDDSPTVRATAGATLLVRHREQAIQDALPLLEDKDRNVRAAIGHALGELGDAAIEPLKRVVETGSEDAAVAAVLGLANAGAEGGVALVSIGHLHPSEKVRTAANLALGKGPPKAHGHTH